MQMKPDQIAKTIVEMSDQAKTMGELHQMLSVITYAVGGLVLHFEKDERSSVIIELTESLGTGLINTAKAMGEQTNLEMIVGKQTHPLS